MHHPVVMLQSRNSSPPMRSCGWCTPALTTSPRIVRPMRRCRDPLPSCPPAPWVPSHRPRASPVTRSGPRARGPPSTGSRVSRATRTCVRGAIQSPRSRSARCSRAWCPHDRAGTRANRCGAWRTGLDWGSRGRARALPTRGPGRPVGPRSTATARSRRRISGGASRASLRPRVPCGPCGQHPWSHQRARTTRLVHATRPTAAWPRGVRTTRPARGSCPTTVGVPRRPASRRCRPPGCARCGGSKTALRPGGARRGRRPTTPPGWSRAAAVGLTCRARPRTQTGGSLSSRRGRGARPRASPRAG